LSTKIPVETAGGTRFYVQVEAEEGPGGALDGGEGVDASLMPRGSDTRAMGPADKVLQTSMFRKAVTVIQDISQEVASSLEQTRPAPSEVQLSLDLGFDAGGNVWLLKGSARASLRLVLKWNMPPAATRR